MLRLCVPCDEDEFDIVTSAAEPPVSEFHFQIFSEEKEEKVIAYAKE